MKRKFLSLILLLCLVVGVMTGCDGGKELEFIDYAAQVTLDMSSETLKQEVTVENFIDGDTTHFKVPTSIDERGVLKARYLACNTPESTGKIEEWGKKASNYTKDHLKNADSIIIETDDARWEKDSTGERYLVWVWYKSADTDGIYRNLNIELLQNGLALGSKAGDTRYGSICMEAINRASLLELHVYSSKPDPDFYYGEAQELTLKELRLNLTDYVGGERVAFEGTVTQYYNNGVYVEDYDEETQRSYGIYLYYGFSLSSFGQELLVRGNRMRIVGKINAPTEAFPNYQVSDLYYDPFDTENPNNIKLIAENQEIGYTETDAATFTSKVSVEVETDDGVSTVSKDFGALALDTAITMKNLVVKSAYTTNNGGNSDGAITFYCTVDGKEISVRTSEKLLKTDGSVLLQDELIGKTIDVEGIVDYYNGTYQIKVFSYSNFNVHQ